VHLFYTAFADPDTKIEFTEAWYRTATFSFNDARYISHFLHNDRSGNRIQPRELVKEVAVDIGYPRREDWVKEVESLEYLFQLKTRTTIILFPEDLSSYYSDPVSVKRAVENVACLFPILRRLKGVGYNVRVRGYRTPEIAVESEGPMVESYVRQLLAARN
jgi:hypothetical protein